MNADELKKYQEQLQQQQAEAIKKAALLKYLTKEARERLNRIKIVRPELAGKVELALLQAVQMGQVNGIITDEQLKKILTEVTEKKQIRILRR
jgi:programmed cell death protein 5